MKHEKFTEKGLQTIEKPASGRVMHFESFTPGLALRVSSSDVRSWIFQGRPRGASESFPRKITIGRYPTTTLAAARQAARKHYDAMQAGVDPVAVTRAAKTAEKAAEVAAARDSFAAVLEKFLKAKELTPAELANPTGGKRRHKPKTNLEYGRVLRGEEFAAWQDRPIKEITKAHVRDAIDAVEKRTKSRIAAGKAFAFLRSLLNWSVTKDYLDVSPALGIEPREKAPTRNRALSDVELRILLSRLQAGMGPFASIYLLLALTGQRLNEIAGLRWPEVHDLNGTEPYVELPPSRTKNKRPHIVPLSPAAVHVLRAMDATRSFSSKFVFSTTGTTPVSGFSKAKQALDRSIGAYKAFGADDARTAGDPRAAEAIDDAFARPWRVHDLRRTVSTGLAKLGTQPHVIDATLNHTSGSGRAQVHGTYNMWEYGPERRAALEMWARHVEQLVRVS